MIPYLGDKSKISDFIKQYIPKNPVRWVEPFGGGFGLYFTLDLREYPDTQFIYNDINPLNCNLFEHLKDDKFIDLVKSTWITKELFDKSYLEIVDKSNKSKKKLKVSNTQSKALAWLIILCCGDLKDLMSGQFRGNSAFEILKYKLPRYSEYFKRMEITNLDYLEVLNKFDSDSTFFYVDPPYVGYESYYLHNTFKDDSHLELSKKLESLTGKWVLSYYKFDQLEDWYNNYKIISTKTAISEEFLVLGN